eukprot:TRINITY_DN3575_c0_g1_i5.p1 TRINITY_DN3575_c0_g1~~TRINITY_DN3575_c0_g1_i5.p1  ORF type:complete len:551 (+),score=33.61 TRINITY_DN3575_c0_g1_i5:43-1695(+)
MVSHIIRRFKPENLRVIIRNAEIRKKFLSVSIQLINSEDDSAADCFNANKPNRCMRLKISGYDCRQSIDVYSSLPSPAAIGGFLGGGSFTKLSSSYISSSLRRRHTPEVIPTIEEPFLRRKEESEEPFVPRKEEEVAEALVKKVPSKKAIVEAPVDLHGLPASHCGFWHALLNAVNVLCGVGLLSTPYAVKEGGWLGMVVLLAFAVLSGYTGILLKECLKSKDEISTYPDIGQAAFGIQGRILVSVVLYAELYACCVEYIILESDNLSALFPNARLNFAGVQLNSHKLFAVLTTVAVLPTTWLKDLSIMSYISAGGVIASIVASGSLFWVAAVDHVELKYKGKLLDFASLPVALGLYGYCYSGHAVYPNIYTSMKRPNQFTKVLVSSFVICTSLYAATAVVGYMMFGELTESQFTLNMPKQYTASKVSVWTTVVNPFTKYALTITPVAMSLEELLPCYRHSYSIAIRSLLVFSTLAVALTVPFFGYVMSLIGSFLTMLVALILPCACYLSILGKKASMAEVVLCILIMLVGAATAVIGSYSSIKSIIQSL